MDSLELSHLEAADLPAALAASCDPGDQLKNKMLNMVFTKTVLDAAKQPDGLKNLQPFGCIAAENGLTTTTLRRPAPTAGDRARAFPPS